MNHGKMMGKNLHPDRRGFWCNCMYCRDGDDYKTNGHFRAREKEGWKKDQGLTE